MTYKLLSKFLMLIFILIIFFFLVLHMFTRHLSWAGNIPASYSGNSRFISYHRDRLSWHVFNVFCCISGNCWDSITYQAYIYSIYYFHM